MLSTLTETNLYFIDIVIFRCLVYAPSMYILNMCAAGGCGCVVVYGGHKNISAGQTLHCHVRYRNVFPARGTQMAYTLFILLSLLL